jgi:hypothetical protein
MLEGNRSLTRCVSSISASSTGIVRLPEKQKKIQKIKVGKKQIV